MKTILFFVLVTFGCPIIVTAQVREFLNELKEIEMFRSDKLRNLTLFVSNKDDVVRVMGKACQSGCDHNANWSLSFGYVGNWGMLKDGQYYRPKAESLGKLSHIMFFAKKSFMITSLDDLPTGVECRTSNGVHEAPAIRNRVCTDRDNRISFYIAAETTSDGKYVDGRLVRITYMPKTADHNNIWELIPK